MSNRSLVEINHDFPFTRTDEDILHWAKQIIRYIGSADAMDLPNGMRLKHYRHHSDPDPMEHFTSEVVGRGENSQEKLLIDFLTESLMIEGIHREPSDAEIRVSAWFMSAPTIGLSKICAVQSIFAPGMPLRTQEGMNVRVGKHIAPAGGMAIAGALGNLANRISQGMDPWKAHVEFETLHPFMDGNGRTGRIVWAWNMRRVMQDPFALSFLHRWYYQTLGASRT